ncbi:MAG: hypothetical protein HDR71_16810 [Lachnospiraceae bacterium]|nr:hypothetical protein [Lachnospiraceae bacterium]
MKRIQSKIYLGLVIIGLSAPLRVNAAGQDMVVLGQDGNQVSVSLEMSNATEEKITTVSISLEVKTDDPEQVTVGFQFAPELGGTEHGFVYNKDSGRLDIYVASSKSLFSEEKLNLGNVQVQPTDPGRSLSADVSYCKNSFQTANGSYGDKTPVIEGEVEPVSIQVGNGTLTPGTGSQGAGNSSGGNSAAGSLGGSNRDQGLYDETTRFTNDPASAQKIDASVIKKDKAETLLHNLSTGAAAAIAGKNGADTDITGRTKAKGKVSVISPKNGPASILISKGDSKASDGDQFDSFSDGLSGDNNDGNAGKILGEGAALEDGQEEIMLDQKNGGAVDNGKSERRRRILIISAISAGVIIIAGGMILLIMKWIGYLPVGAKKKKKKKRRRRKRKPVRKKRRRRRKPVRKKGVQKKSILK